MTQRITNQMLDARVSYLNSIVGIKEPVSYKTIGGYAVYSAYGSTGIEKVVSDSGAVTTIVPLGTKKVTFNRLCSFIDGIVAAKK